MSKKRQPKPDDMKQPFALTEKDLDQVEKLVQAGAEPFWMQDIRLAQRAIQAERERLRAAQSTDSSGTGETTSQD